MQRIGFVVTPGFQAMSFAALSVFEVANAETATPFYDVRLVSEEGGQVRSSIGITVVTESFGAAAFDTLIVGGDTHIASSSPGLVAFLQRAKGSVGRIAAICSGAFHLADAGLLEGRRATTHWLHAGAFRARFPRVTLDPDRIYVADGPIWTSAGMSAGIDLALALVEADLGFELARAVSRKLVMSHRRAGGQSQFSALLELEPKSDRVQSVLTFAKRNLQDSLSVGQLAAAAHLSPRQFSRVFREETGHSPAKAVEKLRVEAARMMLEEGRYPIEVVARETGFSDRERMRRAFQRAFGRAPQTFQRDTRGEARFASPPISTEGERVVEPQRESA